MDLLRVRAYKTRCHAVQTHDDNARKKGDAVPDTTVPPDCSNDLADKTMSKLQIPSPFATDSMLKFGPPPRLGNLRLQRDEILRTEEMENGKQRFLLLHQPGCCGLRTGCHAAQRLTGGEHRDFPLQLYRR
jgi:hypothetical protein